MRYVTYITMTITKKPLTIPNIEGWKGQRSTETETDLVRLPEASGEVGDGPRELTR